MKKIMAEVMKLSLFEVGEMQVPLFVRFGSSGLRYSHFVIFMISSPWSQTKKIRKWLSPEVPNLKKIKALSFLKL